MGVGATHNPLRAAGLVILAMSLIGLIDNLVVRIAEIGSLWQFHLVRAAMALPLLWGVALILGKRVKAKRPWSVYVRGLMIALAMLGYFGALAFMSVAEASAGLFLSPLIVLVVTAWWLKRRVTGWNVLAALGGFVGVLLVLRPEFGGGEAWTRLLPLGAAGFYAAGALATRTICAGESTWAMLHGFFTAALALGAAGCAILAVWPVVSPVGADGFLARGWQPVTGEYFLLIAVQAVGSLIGVGLITRGYELAEAVFVSVFEYSILITGAVWAFFLWRQMLDPLALVGIAMIITCGAALAISERHAARPA